MREQFYGVKRLGDKGKQSRTTSLKCLVRLSFTPLSHATDYVYVLVLLTLTARQFFDHHPSLQVPLLSKGVLSEYEVLCRSLTQA